jgi:uncharacterized protein (TIGR03437 family)
MPCLLLLAYLFSSLATWGASYYVSPAGNDASPGTLDQPFATIQFAADRLNPGDILYLRGGSYRETVTVHQSGSAATPITIQAYAGECPILLGSKPVPGPWTLHQGSIYKASWPAQPQQVFADGHLLNEARWPNTNMEDFPNMTYVAADAGSQDFISYSALPAVDLTGAWVHIMAGQAWVGYSRQVTSHDRASGKLAFSPPINQMTELIPQRGSHFYAFGRLELLTSPGEWWWDPAAQILYVWAPAGGFPEGRVEAGTAPAVLDLSGRSYVTVKGLLARGGWFNLQNCTSCTVKDCHLRAPNWIRTVDGYNGWPQHMGGIDVSGTGNLIEGGSVRLAGRSCVHVAGTGNTVRQMTLEDCGWNWANEAGIMLNESDQSLIERNTVRRTALAGIVMGPRSRVLSNLVENVCLFAEDCGNLNVWQMDGKGAEVAYNVLRGNKVRWGAAIYLDAGSPNFYLHDNLAEGILWSGANITATDTIENNTFADVQHQAINFVPPSNAIGADWSAGRAAHNVTGQPFPLTVTLYQPVSLIPDYAYYFAYTTLKPGPRRVEIDWSHLGQGAWSLQPVPMDLSQVDSVVFALDAPAAPFSFDIASLRLLPAAGSGDTGAVPVSGATWTITCQNGATCALSQKSPGVWTISGSTPFNGTNALFAALPAGSKDLRQYRGLAFDLSGSASRSYNLQGFQDVDNGPDPAPGRGATLPAAVGADPAAAWPVCASTEAYVARGSIVNAASFQPGLAPGCLASVFGDGLADGAYTDLFNLAQNTFPAVVAGTTVLVNGVPAPLTYVSPLQINFQAPWATPVGPAGVQVTRYGFATSSEAVTIPAMAPSAFTVNGTAIVNCAGGAVTAGAACTIWGNGFGPKNSVARDGVPASPTPFLLSDLETGSPCSLTIAGKAAQVTFCGAAPGQITDQLNFIYPPGVPAGSSTVDAILTIGSVSGSFKVPAAVQ